MVDIITLPDNNVGFMSDLPIQGGWVHVRYIRKLLVEKKDPDYARLAEDPKKLVAIELLLAKLEKRLSHCVKRLKDKGIYCDRCFGIYEKLAKSGDPATVARVHMYTLGVDPDGAGLFDSNIPERVWWKALDMTMLVHEPKIHEDPDASYTPLIYDHVTELYFNVLQFLFGEGIVDQLKAQSEFQSETDRKYGELEECIRQQEALINGHEDQTALIRSMRQSIGELRDDFVKERRQWDKREMSYRRTIRELKAKLPGCVPEDGHDTGSGDLGTEEAPHAAAEAREPVVHDLPESGIIFAGADHNLVKKLQLLYPDWLFIETDNRAFPNRPDTRAIFVWSTQMSHAVTERLNSYYGKSVPRFYVTRTNVGALIQEMTARWSEFQESM